MTLTDHSPGTRPTGYRRVALTVDVVLEIPDIDDYYDDDPAELDGYLTEGGLADDVAATFAGFVRNEIDNCAEYAVNVLRIDAHTTAVTS